MDLFHIAEFAGYLNRRNGWTIDTSYYSYIQEWKHWWEGFVKEFHQISAAGADGNLHTRTIYRMEMAKKICEDWATILLSDETIIKASDPKTNQWLAGDQNRKGFLDAVQFYDHSNRLIEEMMRSGACAWVLTAEEMQVENGRVIPNSRAKLWVDYLPAEYILPLTIRHGEVVEAAFVSEVLQEGKSFIYLQTHLLKSDGYHIRNEYFRGTGSTAADSAFVPCALPRGMAKELATGSTVPLFSVATPNAVKSITGGNGLGMAVFATALDQLKAVDKAFHNFVKDLELGGKKVFYDKSLVQYRTLPDGTTVPVTPDDIQNQLFLQLGDGDDLHDSRDPIHEYNPSLRVEENAKAVQHALDYLSFQCGLGTQHYRFDPVSVKTATEYTGDRQDMRQHARKHQIPLRAALVRLMRGILWAAKTIQGADVDPETEITVEFGDSFFTDENAERMQMAQDARDGFLPPYRYTMRWYDLDEETARQWVQETKTEESADLRLFDEV